jgi:hypothetical protein
MGWLTSERAAILARDEFLKLLRVNARQVIEELSGEPYQRLTECKSTEVVSREMWNQIVNGFEKGNNKEIKNLRESLLEWQSRWNLIEADGAPKWCIAAALRTLASWRVDRTAFFLVLF